MKYDPISRRFFLQGLGQFTLALPFLSSFPGLAQAQTKPPLRFVGIRSWYGQTPENWYKNLDRANVWAQVAPGVYGTQISQLTGPINKVIGTRFDSVKSKMSMLMGLDIMSEVHDHNNAAMLCASGVPNEGAPPFFPYSMDAIFENSSIIYPAAPSKTRVLRLAPALAPSNDSFSWNVINGQAVRLPSQSNAQSVFGSLFDSTPTGGGGQTPDQKKSLVIDKVLPDLNRVLASNKLSVADKGRVSNYADLMRDLQTRLQASPPATQCQNPTLNNDSSMMKSAYSNHFDMIVAALACGLTKVATVEVRHYENNPNFLGSQFHDGTHVESSGQDAKSLVENSWIADRVAELFTKLNAIVEPDGSRLLDNTITFWGNELSCRQSIHRLENMPVVIAGGQGRLKSGWSLDYRQRPFRYYANRSDFPEVGRPYNELLISLMSAMGLSPADWEKNGQAGFGSYTKGGYYNKEYDAFLNNRRSPLPFYSVGV